MIVHGQLPGGEAAIHGSDTVQPAYIGSGWMVSDHPFQFAG